jgi:hypothetical protein
MLPVTAGLAGSLLLAAALAPLAAAADPVEEFYRGKILNLYIGTGENASALTAYPRAIAEVIGRYIPGHPTLVVRNMPGAGGIKAANYVYAIGPQDGTVWGFITRGFLLAPLFGVPQVQFDPSKFNWIGSPARTDSVGAVWQQGTAVRTIQDAMRQEVIVGATTLSQGTGTFPLLLNRLIGTRFKVVSGYASSGDVDLAMERGEVQGKVDWTLGALLSGRSGDWFRDGKLAILVQLGLAKSPKLDQTVPLALDLARSPADRQLLTIVCTPSATGYPSFMGPGVPPERVAAIRDAYRKTMEDADFGRLVAQQKLDVEPIDGAEIERIVASLYRIPRDIVDRARELLPPPS